MVNEIQPLARKIETNENANADKINSAIKLRNTSLYYEPPVLFVHNKEEEISAEAVQKFITLHEGEKPRYNYLYDLYKGKHEILTLPEKDKYKPDNRLVVNFPKYLTDSFNGYFVGVPPRVSHPDKEINEKVSKFNKKNEMDDVINELSKQSLIFGRSYAVVYQNEKTETCVTYNSPLDMFVVYDDTIEQNPLFAVKYNDTEDGIKGEVFTLDSHFLIVPTNDGIKLEDDPDTAFYYGQLSICEFYANEERTSLFEPIITLNNAFNKAFSEKGNDVDYFADAYLAVLGAELDQDGVNNIRENRVINMFGKGTGNGSTTLEVKFLEKPNADESQEHYLDRLERFIFTMAMVVNINDDDFGNAASGASLMYKLMEMSNLALTVERKFTSALNNVYKMFFSVPLNFDKHDEEIAEEWFDLDYTFTRNVPKNLKEEAEIMTLLDTHVSEETKLSVLSIIKDIKAEQEKIKQESPVIDIGIDSAFKKEAPYEEEDDVDG